ncbi:MAG: tRNA (adenosine(37)-N6)-threonylcarbamoyltransferase complex dimerization subunit type 1 TsaB [Steroidobacteraceae bacterium]
MRLLALDTASAQCSVALLDGGHVVAHGVATAREHAQLLLPMVDALLAECGTTLRALDGIAFGRGPGSFTGVRIAAAVTQGLAAGADLPVLPVSDLRALAELAREQAVDLQAAGWVLACMDARMGELYWALYDGCAGPVTAAAGGEQLSGVGELLAQLPGLLPPGAAVAAAAGMGLSAYPQIAAALGLPPARSLGAAEPHAAQVARLAAADLAQGARWLDAAAAQPVYLRDKVTHGPTL